MLFEEMKQRIQDLTVVTQTLIDNSHEKENR